MRFIQALSGALRLCASVLLFVLLIAAPSAAAPSPYRGVSSPTSRPRILLTGGRLAAARQYYASHPFTPRADDPFANALRYQMTGESSYARVAAGHLMSFTISESELAGTASNNYRWADWVPVVFDWVYDQMTPAERSTFIARYNRYTEITMAKGWGGVDMPASNYFWGFVRNALNWSLATWHENDKAQQFVDHVLEERWSGSFLPYARGVFDGGVPHEGSQYGRYTLEYPLTPFSGIAALGRDLFRETNYYREAAFWLIYSMSPAPTDGRDGSHFYQLFPFADDHTTSGRPAAGEQYYIDFMSVMASHFSGTPLAEWARRYIELNDGEASWHLRALASGGPSRSFASLPLDYYAPGISYLYTRSSWDSAAALVNLQLSGLRGGHEHLDYGSFQLNRGGRWLSKETTGYSHEVAGYAGTGTAGTDAGLPHNVFVFEGIGPAGAYIDGPPQVTRLENREHYSFASVNLSQAYRAHASNHPDRDDNPYAHGLVRDFVFVRPPDTLVIFDRAEASSDAKPAATVAKAALIHFPNAPVSAGSNVYVGTNGDQQLRVTSFASTPLTLRVVDEYRPEFGDRESATDFQHRLEVETRGAAHSYMLNVLQAKAVGAANLTVNLTERAELYELTLTHPQRGSAVVTFAKTPSISQGGGFAWSASGVPSAVSPFTSSVQGIEVYESGPVWEGNQPPVSPTPLPTVTPGGGGGGNVNTPRACRRLERRVLRLRSLPSTAKRRASLREARKAFRACVRSARRTR